MKTEASEYVPQGPGRQPEQERQKAFHIVPAEDSRTRVIIEARTLALEDGDLKFGARCLFSRLLDLSLSWYTQRADGVVVISVTKLCDMLKCSPSSIYRWNAQLTAKRYLWVTEQRMPNMWPVNTYHIAALDSPDEPRQMPTKDGMWGNGVRRNKPEAGQGARAYPSQNERRAETTDPQKTQEMTGESATKKEVSAVKMYTGEPSESAPGSRQKESGEPSESIPGSRQNVQLRGSKKRSGPPAKTVVNKESIDVSLRPLETSLNVQRGNAFKKGGENAFLQHVADVLTGYSKKFAKAELVNSGAWWRMKFRKDPDKASRVLAEINRMIKEGVGFSNNPGAAAVDLWERFV